METGQIALLIALAGLVFTAAGFWMNRGKEGADAMAVAKSAKEMAQSAINANKELDDKFNDSRVIAATQIASLTTELRAAMIANQGVEQRLVKSIDDMQASFNSMSRRLDDVLTQLIANGRKTAA